MFLYILFFMFPFILIIYKFKNKIRVKWKTFLKKGFKPNRGIFGIYTYVGKQGSGKTLSLLEFLHSNNDKPIFCNLKSIKGIKYTYIANFKELLSLRNQTDCIIVFDELFTALQKNSVISKDVLDFLSQMRKRRIICLTTAQEWAEIPLTWRRYCRYQISCKLIRLPFINGILIKKFFDAENMKWSTEDNDFVAPLLDTTISHTQKWIADSYDTFEQISNNDTDVGLYEIFQPLPSKVSVKPSKEKVSKAVAREEFSNDSDFDKDFWSDIRKEDVSD